MSTSRRQIPAGAGPFFARLALVAAVILSVALVPLADNSSRVASSPASPQTRWATLDDYRARILTVNLDVKDPVCSNHVEWLGGHLYRVPPGVASFTIYTFTAPDISETVLLPYPIPGAKYQEPAVRLITGDYLYFGVCRPQDAFSSLSYEFKLNLRTQALSNITPGGIQGHVAFQSVYDAGDHRIYAVGQSNNAGNLPADVMVIDTTNDNVSHYQIPGTSDANELTAVLDDGANIIAAEQTGVWVIPKATIANPATYSKHALALGPGGAAHARLFRHGGTYYIFTDNFHNFQSNDLINWTPSQVFASSPPVYAAAAPIAYDGANDTLYGIGNAADSSVPGGYATYILAGRWQAGVYSETRHRLNTGFWPFTMRLGAPGKLILGALYGPFHSPPGNNDFHDFIEVDTTTWDYRYLSFHRPGSVEIQSEQDGSDYYYAAYGYNGQGGIDKLSFGS